MAESDKAKSLSEDYLLKDVEEKLKVESEPEEKPTENVEPPVTVTTPAESAPAVSEEVAPPEENVSGPTPPADVEVTEPTPTEEPTETVTEETTKPEPETETPEIKLETAPGDYRFPTTNQSRHCFTRYVEYHRCVAAKGEDASECDKFAKYYRSLCPGEWVDRWNEQRENGTFPGPL